jgi:hypothetical protein
VLTSVPVLSSGPPQDVSPLRTMAMSNFDQYKTELVDWCDASSDRGEGEVKNTAEPCISMCVLESLIECEDWDGVADFFKSAPEAAGTRISNNSSTRTKSSASSGNLPLHVICSHQSPPASLVNMLLELNEDAARAPGEHGYLPLHCACASGASTDVISRLIEVYPAACQSRDVIGGALPLHLGARAGASEEAMMEVLCVYPEASFMRDYAGKTPLDYARALPEAVRNSVLYVIETAPILVETAKCASARVETTFQARIRGMQEAQAEFIRQLEQRQEEEIRGFMQMEIQFHNELADEKERNISLAETALTLQLKEKKLKAELAEAGTLLRIEREENKSRNEANELELMQILEGALGLEGEDDKKPITTKLMQFATRYEQSQTQIAELKKQEGMVHHLNQLLSSKDNEIKDIKLKQLEEESAKQLATKKASRFEKLHGGAQHELNHAQEENKRSRTVIETQQMQLQETNRIRRVQESRLGTINNLISSLSYNIDTWSMEDDWDRRSIATHNSPVSLEGIEHVRKKDQSRRRVHPSKRGDWPDKSDCEKSICDTHRTAVSVSTRDSGPHDEDEDMSALSLAQSPSRPRSAEAVFAIDRVVD